MEFTDGPRDLSTTVDSVAKGSAYRFADFFAGLGGFRVALEKLGHNCVFSCEIDDELRKTYLLNFGSLPVSDIRHVKASDVPPHEILCAGFPCQPFSLAGKKNGAECPESGELINDVFRIVRHHRQRYVLLENVPNILSIANGTFWAHITSTFKRLGYIVEYRVFSPLEFGIPQQRQRVFVVARRKDAPAFDWPSPSGQTPPPLQDFLAQVEQSPALMLEPEKMRVLEKWSEFVRRIPPESSHTILAAEFGANYPLDGLPTRGWRELRGAYGSQLGESRSRTEALLQLPHYAAQNGGCVPDWMRPYVLTSRKIYARSKRYLDGWKKNMPEFHNSWQKLDWRGDRNRPELWSHTIQFRASGIRIMRSDLAPSLVAMTTTQTPIVGPLRRYMTVREAAALQALDNLITFPEFKSQAFSALGNAVNARIVEEVARAAIR